MTSKTYSVREITKAIRDSWYGGYDEQEAVVKRVKKQLKEMNQ